MDVGEGEERDWVAEKEEIREEERGRGAEEERERRE